MDAYVRLLIKTCHKRGVHAMGGMAAQIPIKNDPAANEAALAKVCGVWYSCNTMRHMLQHRVWHLWCCGDVCPAHGSVVSSTAVRHVLIPLSFKRTKLVEAVGSCARWLLLCSCLW
jgi:hypothetical protein